MCILSTLYIAKVVGYNDLSVLSMSVRVSKKKSDVGGWGELYPSFFWMFGIFFNFAKPLRQCVWSLVGFSSLLSTLMCSRQFRYTECL